MTRWKRHLNEFIHSWAFVCASYAMDCCVYPSPTLGGGIYYTREWLMLRDARRAAGRPMIRGVDYWTVE